MKRIYSKFRITLMAFTLGLAAVFMWNGFSISWREVPVDLPVVSSGEVIEVTVPDYLSEHPRKYVCEDEHEPNAHASCIHQVIFSDRDISLYDDGGNRGCGLDRLDRDSKNCERSMAKARAFVWDHWRQKKRGYVMVSYASPDFEWVTHIFIEPDDNGRWRIAERTMPMLAPGESEEGLDDLHEVKWKRATRDDERFGVKLGTLYLELSDDVGDSLIL